MVERKHQVHFVGIGGSGMSGIAEGLLDMGKVVRGTDLHASGTVPQM
jgi:UDP-N-acetylmuramate--alanine ligase